MSLPGLRAGIQRLVFSGGTAKTEVAGCLASPARLKLICSIDHMADSVLALISASLEIRVIEAWHG